MTKKFISRQMGLPLQPAKSSFSPRPFAPTVQAKGDTTAASSVEHLSQNSNLLSRLIHSESTFESQQIGSEVGIKGPKIQRKHQDNLAQVSALPPTAPSAPRFPIQAKLTVGAAGDKYEQEADRVARQVVNRIQAPQVNLNSSQSNPVQRKISIQALGGEGGDVSSEWESQLNQAKGGGQPLSPSLREPMEREFGADFSGVRVHTGGQADNLAKSIQAKAFTIGQEVFFQQGVYQPGSRDGQELIAHELAHVVQQGGSAVRRAPLRQLRFERSESIIQRKPLEQQEQEQLRLAQALFQELEAGYEGQKEEIETALRRMEQTQTEEEVLGISLIREKADEMIPRIDKFFQDTKEKSRVAHTSTKTLENFRKALNGYQYSGGKNELLNLLKILRNKQTQRELPRERSTLQQITPLDEKYFNQYLKRAKPPVKVYRGDGRSIDATSLDNYQFTDIHPGGTPDISFYGVVEHTFTNTAKNGMVSTTTDFEGAKFWATNGHKYGLVYEIEVDKYINVTDLLTRRAFKERYPGQYEILVPGIIPAKKVISATLYENGKAIKRVKNRG
ncbi:DUF4157 domain-containing protein [Laspinema olomoucense]|uniref:DUF4157 domain-containing protein n=1 Tax=Laspinema olomoucense TaxID=3231600 RepID=UPI0021BA83B6|nr:DUF4157 domain-containing protein [Laspinema sp. D3a]MCT7991999.1 DUF4157 domain-containing protein [Laspinema sp. D3a]